MNCRLWGSKPYHAVAVHGGPGAPGSASSLAAGLSMVVGTIEPFQTATTVFGQVDELARQIEELTDEKVFAFGHSWGAWLVYLLAYRHPGLVRKAVLIGPGAFDARYLKEMTRRRLSRLSPVEAQEYWQIVRDFEGAAAHELDSLLARLGELAGKADAYDVEDIPENRDRPVGTNGSQYQSVWAEGAKLRKEGFFIGIADKIDPPVRIIHGLDDPTPIEGVIDPVKDRIRDLKWYGIPQCGHSPWKEKYGKERFWQIIADEMG
jgi:pimeloyl-ACP methyl ester carboxylesterase